VAVTPNPGGQFEVEVLKSAFDLTS
jgi:hypothetical protein